ncbi:MAG TPA: sulfurtransferase [Anaerolineae bacterium]|nr:sulfurtransferase [Anaerolineae bacterium]
MGVISAGRATAYTTLVSTDDLARHLADPDWALVDCRFTLSDTGRGRRDYLQAHIPGAVYAHLYEDLSGPFVPGQTGRHPLPEVDAITRTLSGWGIDAATQVVVYDDSGGSMAARLWWMLRWLGHAGAAVLDGGWPRWLAGEHETRGGHETRAALAFVPHVRLELLATTADVLAALGDPGYRLFDSRTEDRYRGENETIDPVAGHIPGAVPAPYPDNLGVDGLFRAPRQLRARFERLLGGVPGKRAAFYCGSGVTAAHNLLALAHAGLGEARLYAGSWSEWIADPHRPIQTGNENAA